MYSLKTESHFDSAHFLANYDGKCGNIHGHRWKIEIEVVAEELKNEGQEIGMVVDFGILKRDLKEIADDYDHTLIIEKGTMRKETLNCLIEDSFKIIELDFRPTAENFAKSFFDIMAKKGYNVKQVTVYETPVNCATYSK
ncbi:MAG: 6-carboxytetrahydropterin synthase QueD [Fusobacteriia bacterium 4572_132]|nr:MAG: 6-carboxytetrahydropterin synthase QueD [Fusobacteriia bacterium 4572_132]